MKNMILEIISIPMNLYEIGNEESFYSLLKRTGYLDVSIEISTEDLYNELIHNERYIQYWINWSENKRVRSGWYFQVINENSFEIGELNGVNVIKQFFSNRTKACAMYIKKEIEEVRFNS